MSNQYNRCFFLWVPRRVQGSFFIQQMHIYFCFSHRRQEIFRRLQFINLYSNIICSVKVEQTAQFCCILYIPIYQDCTVMLCSGLIDCIKIYYYCGAILIFTTYHLPLTYQFNAKFHTNRSAFF